MADYPCEVELLYFGHGNVGGTSRHNHSYFQLEYCIGGLYSAWGNGEELVLRPGDYWLIPPGFMHKFYNNKKSLDFISVKFSSPVNIGSKIGHDLLCRYYLEKICSVLDGETPFSPYSCDGKKVIENYLSGILRHLVRPEIENPKSKFETMLQNRIYQFGAPVNVGSLAEKCGMTRTEFKYRFRQEIGHGRIKNYIDSILLKMSDRHLLYSDSPLNKVAHELHFPSIYAFSRYFKHHRGITPSEFRRRAKLQ